MIEIELYNTSLRSEWNQAVNRSKNGTFLHLREYMDYHSDRFDDFSLIARNKGKIIGVLPANRRGNVLYSHQGLSYGGWLVPTKHFDVTNMLEIFNAMVQFLKASDIEELYYKPTPYIYHSYPSQEDLYALFMHNATLEVSNISTAIPLENPLRFNENSRRAVNTAINNGVKIVESTDYKGFWQVLSTLLNNKYNVNPVHSVEEIELLHSRFPNNIKLFLAVIDNEILGGTVMYDTGIVAHAQYISSTEEGREKKVLPLLFKYLISEVYADRQYFDFGISNEDGGRYLNQGLVMQKTGMGGRGIVYDTYHLKI